MSSRSRSRNSRGRGTKNSVPPINDPPKPLTFYVEVFEDWLGYEEDVYMRERKTLNERQLNYWKELTELVKNQIIVTNNDLGKIISFVARTTKKVFYLTGLRVSASEGNEDRILLGVGAAALDCLNVTLQTVSNGFEERGFDQKIYDSFKAPWIMIIEELLSRPLTDEVSIVLITLDVYAAMGSDIYFQLPDRLQKRLIVSMIGYGSAEYQEQLHTSTKSKIGRCLGKFIQFPSLRDSLPFFLDVFEITGRGINSTLRDVQISYAWTFGNLTDVLISEHMLTPLEDMSVGFVTLLLSSGVQCLQVPTKGRYNSCRACGNIFQWMRLGMLEPTNHKEMVASMSQQLISSVGSGLDYKMRWNSAHALGFALGNEIFFQVLPEEVTAPIIQALSKWVALSQNYKERAQCAVSLRKPKTRDVYGAAYPLVLERLCLGLTRLPVEDCDSFEKFKIEAVLALFHLMNLLRLDDIPQIEPIVQKYREILKSNLEGTIHLIPLECVDIAYSSKDNLLGLVVTPKSEQDHATVKVLYEMVEEVLDFD